MNNKNFVAEIRRRYDVKRDGNKGSVVVNLVLDTSENPLTLLIDSGFFEFSDRSDTSDSKIKSYVQSNIYAIPE